MNNFVMLTAAIALIASAATIAQAQEPQSIRVKTHDLVLTSAKDQRTLGLRIARAASQLCDTVNPRFDAKVRTAQRHCREQAVSAALSSIPPKTRLVAR